MAVINQIKAGGVNYNIASTAYATCDTASGTVAKVATCSGFTLMSGVTIHVKFTNSNTASNPTLNVNGTGAKAIKMYGTTAVGTSATTSWYAGAVVSCTYDGTNWIINDYKTDTNTTYTLSSISGTLPVSKGGTGVTSLTSGALLMGNGTGNVTTVSYLSDTDLISYINS